MLGACTQQKRINDRHSDQAEFFNAIDVKRLLRIGVREMEAVSRIEGENSDFRPSTCAEAVV
jgi:hypothetical protein